MLRRDPSVASDTSGNFVVVWRGVGQDDGLGVFGQRYDGAGVAQGDQFLVNSYTPRRRGNHSVAFDSSGNFVVVWYNFDLLGHGVGQDDNFGIFGQRYDSAGVPLGSEFRINSFTAGGQGSPSVAAAATGDFVAVWDGQGLGDSAGVGPPSGMARVRVASTDDAGVSDTSDVTFQIRPAPLSATDELLQR